MTVPVYPICNIFKWGAPDELMIGDSETQSHLELLTHVITPPTVRRGVVNRRTPPVPPTRRSFIDFFSESDTEKQTKHRTTKHNPTPKIPYKYTSRGAIRGSAHWCKMQNILSIASNCRGYERREQGFG